MSPFTLTSWITDLRMPLTQVPARFASFLPDVAAFDAAAFGLSEKEAGLMDPQQRLLLEASYEALSSANGHMANGHMTVGGEDAAGRRTGVYVGVSAVDYSKTLMRHSQVRHLCSSYIVCRAR